MSCLGSELSKEMPVLPSDTILKSRDEERMTQSWEKGASGAFGPHRALHPCSRAGER